MITNFKIETQFGGWNDDDENDSTGCCFITLDSLGYRIDWVFRVEEDRPVEEWTVEDIQLQQLLDPPTLEDVKTLAQLLKDDPSIPAGGSLIWHARMRLTERARHLADSSDGLLGPEVWELQKEKKTHIRRAMVLGDAPEYVLVSVRLKWLHVRQVEAERIAAGNTAIEESHRMDIIAGVYEPCKALRDDDRILCDVCREIVEAGMLP